MFHVIYRRGTLHFSVLFQWRKSGGSRGPKAASRLVCTVLVITTVCDGHVDWWPGANGGSLAENRSKRLARSDLAGEHPVFLRSRLWTWPEKQAVRPRYGAASTEARVPIKPRRRS